MTVVSDDTLQPDASYEEGWTEARRLIVVGFTVKAAAAAIGVTEVGA